MSRANGHRHHDGRGVIVGQTRLDSGCEPLPQAGNPINRLIVAPNVIRTVYNVAGRANGLPKEPKNSLSPAPMKNRFA
jgi:hypothetical protein